MSRYDLSGLTMEIHGASASCLRGLDRYWSAFKVADSDRPAWLTLDMQSEGVVRARPILFLGNLQREILADEVRFHLDSGRASLSAEGRASMVMAEPDDDSDYGFFVFMNLLMPLLAWRLIEEGGLLLHAAGAVIEDRAFLLVGEENAGKTTWARLCYEAGCAVVNDDVVVVRPDESGRFYLHGVPLRVRGFGDPPRGAWPLARLLFSNHGKDPALTERSGLAARARVLANVLHLADRVEEDPRVDRALSALLKDAGASTLTFAKATRFVELLKAVD